MERQQSASSRIGKSIESGTTEEAEKPARFIIDRLPSMNDEHLTQLHDAASMSVNALKGNIDHAVVFERTVRTSALFLSGGAMASGMYALVPLLLPVAFADHIPGLQTPSAARDEKRKVAERVLEAIQNERARRDRHRTS